MALDYCNPYLSPFQEFQRFKNASSDKGLFEGENALLTVPALNEGGWQALPQLVFPGGSILAVLRAF